MREHATGAATASASLALGAVLVLPFLLRPTANLLDREGEPLAIVTPHNEPIRYEFARAFRAHMQGKGRAVRIDWRVPGGSNEITRFLASEYAVSFERYWKTHAGLPWTSRVAAAFASPAMQPNEEGPDEHHERLARRMFLGSDAGIGIDLFFGGGTQDSILHAAAGRLVDSGIVRSHPELFHDAGIPEKVGGEPYWDKDGRWVGACLSGYGICYNRDSLTRLGIEQVPSSWADLADPIYFGQIALADPSKSGSSAKAFEMVIQQQMNARAAELASEGAAMVDLESRAPAEGWDRAMRLIRRISANARYFSDSAPKIPLDVAVGDAAAGMCLDFYGRFQSEASSTGAGTRLGFITPAGGTSMNADPIGLLRGAPHRELALEFLEFVLSPEGQKLWNFKVGTPGGPERYALRRLPILPELYAAAYEPLRSDPTEQPYEQARSFTYHESWTGALYRTIAFVVRVMCVDVHDDLGRAYRALSANGFPPHATALFDDVAVVDYAAAKSRIRSALTSPNPVDEVVLANELLDGFRSQYRRVAELAREGG
ncbi:MAG TPA: extracellular solute-binding protein [Polyangiaceae bacterium]